MSSTISDKALNHYAMQRTTLVKKITNIDCDSLGKYLNDISREQLLTSDEEIDLIKRIKQGDQQARDKLVRANLRFVVSVAKQYQGGKVPLSDLINEGNIGLIKAAEKFDETRGFRFISYAVWWIKQLILSALDEQSRLIKIPSNKLALLSRIRKAVDNWEKRFGRAPSKSELAETLSLDEGEVVETINAFYVESSLYSPLQNDSNHSLLELIPDPNSYDSKEQSIQSEQLKKEVNNILTMLDEREKRIIEMTFGINCSITNSLDEISNQLGITRERVRQIKEKALKKLSYRGIRKKIKSYAFP